MITGCGGAADDEPSPSASGPSTLPPATSSSPTATPTTSLTGGEQGGPPSVAGEVVTGLDSPWSIAFLPDGSALVSQRDDALIRKVNTDDSLSDVGEVPGVDPGGEGGLLGLAISPSYDSDHMVYAYFTAASDNRIARMTYDGDKLGEPDVIVDGLAKGSIHNGGRLAFGPDGMLYAGVGETGNPSLSQDTSALNGKILRMTPDGSVPPDNPFGNLVWSYGHRNVQGLAFDAEGRLWASEFGQSTWDELNLIQRGGNSGWPVVEGQAGRDGMIDPVAQWPTDDASPSGIAIVGSTVFMASLKGARLWTIPLPDEAGRPAGEPTAYFVGEYGRLRDVVNAPDGSLWLLTDNTDGRGRPREGDDRILRLTLG
jgi:glucose/arabinose dehydrogenase